MLSLEHFKLLGAKAGSLHRGTGGKPDITFQEVADVLAEVPYAVSLYARYIYGMQREVHTQLVRQIALSIRTKDDIKVGVVRDTDIRIAELVLRVAKADYPLTHGQKAYLFGVPWWRPTHEERFKKAQQTIDNYEFEIRYTINRWNERAENI